MCVLLYSQSTFNHLGETTMKSVKQLKLTTVSKAVALTLGVLTASSAFAGTTPVQPYDLGLLKNFNIVARDSIHVRTSDMQCGVAAYNHLKVYGGYSIGKSNVEASINGTTVTTTFAKAPLGILIGQNLNWGSHITAKVPYVAPWAVENPASGTINGDVFFSNSSGALIAPDAAVTLTPPGKLFNLSTAGLASLTTVYAASWAGFLPAAPVTDTVASNNVSQLYIAYGDTTATNFRNAWYSAVYPATGTTVARTFYKAPASVAWPVVPTEDRYNIDLTDVIGDAVRGTAASGAWPFNNNQLYVFDVDADKLSMADTVRLNKVRNFNDWNNDQIRNPLTDGSSWVVIRVNASAPGTTVRFGSMGMQDLAGMASRTLWLFPSTVTKIEIGGTSFEGSIIAPEADVESLNGQFNGTMFVKNFQGPKANAGGLLPQPKAFTTTALTTELTTYPGTLEGHCAVFEAFPGGDLYTP